MRPTKQRPYAIENNDHADCPFFVERIAPFIDEQQLPKKRKRGILAYCTVLSYYYVYYRTIIFTSKYTTKYSFSR